MFRSRGSALIMCITPDMSFDGEQRGDTFQRLTRDRRRRVFAGLLELPPRVRPTGDLDQSWLGASGSELVQTPEPVVSVRVQPTPTGAEQSLGVNGLPVR